MTMRNKYCSNCLRTRRFADMGTYLACERCSKRLERVEVKLRPMRAVERHEAATGKRRNAM